MQNPQLSDEQIAVLQRVEDTVAAISGAVIRAVKSSGMTYGELSKRADLSVAFTQDIMLSPACNGTIEDVAAILAAIGLELKVDIVPIQTHKETTRYALDLNDFTQEQTNG